MVMIISSFSIHIGAIFGSENSGKFLNVGLIHMNINLIYCLQASALEYDFIQEVICTVFDRDE